MADERAVCASQKIHRSRSEEKRIEVMTTLEQRRWHTARIIAAEYADVIAENERLRSELELQEQSYSDASSLLMVAVQENERLKAEIAEECHDADSYFDKSRHQEARIAELEQQVAAMRAGIDSFRAYCQSTCGNQKCYAWRGRGRRCPTCPLDQADELDAHLQMAAK